MAITFPSNTKQVIDEIREAIGREINFVTKVEADCPTCTINPVTNTSVDPFCPTCSGFGYLYTLSGYAVNAHVTWGKADIMNWQPAGRLFDGDCRVQVEYIPETVTVVENCNYVEVDGKKMIIKDKALRGVKEINRIVLSLKEKEKEA